MLQGGEYMGIEQKSDGLLVLGMEGMENQAV